MCIFTMSFKRILRNVKANNARQYGFTALCFPLILLFFSGCANYFITPKGEATFIKGVQVLYSQKQFSKAQAEIAQKNLQDNVLVLYVGAELLSGKPLLFSTDSISARFEGQPLKIYSYDKLRNSELNFIDILQLYNIPTPTPNVQQQNFYNISPMYYYGYGGFLFSPPMMSPFFSQSPTSIAYMQEKRGALKVFLMNYLRESSLKPNGKAQGGFIAIAKKGINKNGILEVKIQIANEEHIFYFKIRKMKTI